MAGNLGDINGTEYPGTVRALNPATGAYIWQHAAPGPVIGALAYDNGMVLDGGGSVLEVLNAATGARLYSYDTGAQIYAGPSVADGVIYTGNTNGQVLAFALPSTPPASPPPDPNCPSGFTCQDIGGATPAGSEAVSGSTWSVTAGGAGVGSTSDQFRMISEPTSGDAQVTAEITGAACRDRVAGGRDDPAEQRPWVAVLRRLRGAGPHPDGGVPHSVRRRLIGHL